MAAPLTCSRKHLQTKIHYSHLLLNTWQHVLAHIWLAFQLLCCFQTLALLWQGSLNSTAEVFSLLLPLCSIHFCSQKTCKIMEGSLTLAPTGGLYFVMHQSPYLSFEAVTLVHCMRLKAAHATQPPKYTSTLQHNSTYICNWTQLTTMQVETNRLKVDQFSWQLSLNSIQTSLQRHTKLTFNQPRQFLCHIIF